MNEDYMIVRQSDAHAWTEAFIDGAWRRYDPTGAVAPSRVQQGLAAALPDEASVPRLARLESGWLRDAQLRWDALNHHWQRLIVDFDDDSQQKFWDRLGFGQPALWQITVIVLMLAAAWCAAVLGVPRLTRSSLPAEERQWQRLCRLLRARKLVRAADETPTEYLQRAGTHWPAQAARLQALQQLFDALRFQRLSEAERSVKQQELQRQLRRLSWAAAR
jgi:hypothetical protein